MRQSLCRHCGQLWSLLHDGTLVEHPQPRSPFLLCPGARTKPSEETDLPEATAPEPLLRLRHLVASGTE